MLKLHLNGLCGFVSAAAVVDMTGFDDNEKSLESKVAGEAKL